MCCPHFLYSGIVLILINIGSPSAHTTTGLKRNPAVAAATEALGSDKVQEAIVEKGIEVVGNAIDKQIANIEGAQNKSEAFLNKRVYILATCMIVVVV
jgi:hypothetical protein